MINTGVDELMVVCLKGDHPFADEICDSKINEGHGIEPRYEKRFGQEVIVYELTVGFMVLIHEP